MKRILDRIVYLVVILIIVFFANIHWFLRLSVPHGYTSNWVHGSNVDYYTYLTVIREGSMGKWMVQDLFTNDKTQSSYIYSFYIVAGQISRITRTAPVETYHMTRVLSLVLLIFSIFSVTRIFTKNNDVLPSCLLGIISTAPVTWSFLFQNNIVKYTDIAGWWNNLDPLFRFDYVPHHTFGIACMLLALVYVFSYIRSGRWRYLFLCGLMSVFSTLSYPAPASVLLVGLPVAAVLWVIRSFTGRASRDIRVLVGSLVSAICVACIIVVLQGEISKGFPWIQWRIWDAKIWNNRENFLLQLVIAQGVTLILAMPSIISAFLKPKHFSDYLLGVWVILPVLLYPFFLIFEIAVIRLVFFGTFIPTGIFAIRTLRLIKAPDRITNYVPYIGVCVLFILQIPSYQFFYEQKRALYSYTSTDILTPNGVKDAMTYIAHTVTPYSVVLSNAQVGLMLPSMGPVISYFAHPIHTQYFFDKLNRTNAFFRGALNPNGLHMTLDQGNISYIFWGPDEKKLGFNIIEYGLPLVPVYTNTDVIVYELRR